MKYSYFIAFTYQEDRLKIPSRARPNIFFIIYVHVERYQCGNGYLHYRSFEEGLDLSRDGFNLEAFCVSSGKK